MVRVSASQTAQRSSRTSRKARFAVLGLAAYFLCASICLLLFHLKSLLDILNDAKATEKNAAVGGGFGPAAAAALHRPPRSNDGNFGNEPPPPPEPFAYERHECYQPTSPKPYKVEYCRPETHPDLRERIRTARKILITYGQNCCVDSKRRACDRALSVGGFDSCFAYDATDVDPEFAIDHADVLDEKRGAGYWLWKPHVIRKTLLERMDWNDYLVYHDAGAYFDGNSEDLFLFLEDRIELNGGALFFSTGMKQSKYCKRDAFVLQHCDEPKCHDAKQIDGYVAVFKKTEHALRLLDAWLTDAVRRDVIADKTPGEGSGEPELEGFYEHRHDQAVLTNVMNRDGWWYDTVNGPVHGRLIVHDRAKGRTRHKHELTVPVNGKKKQVKR